MADAGEQSEPKDCDELKVAIDATEDNEKGRQQYLIKRAVELGCVEHVPDDWEVSSNG